ncbi:hypothetical protein BH23GEM11_BH23GEM11_08940 [soil metagenome]
MKGVEPDPQFTSSNVAHAAPGVLLAVDAGLRAGIAIYGANGRLERYRSTNFGSPRRLKSGVYRVMSEQEGLAQLVVEGGGNIADPWMREAGRRGLPALQVHAGIWRERLLLPRDRRTGAAAKLQADDLARRVISWAGAPRPTSLRHDASEAILVGLWGVLEVGWLPVLPAELRPG